MMLGDGGKRNPVIQNKERKGEKSTLYNHSNHINRTDITAETVKYVVSKHIKNKVANKQCC